MDIMHINCHINHTHTHTHTNVFLYLYDYYYDHFCTLTFRVGIIGNKYIHLLYERTHQCACLLTLTMVTECKCTGPKWKLYLYPIYSFTYMPPFIVSLPPKRKIKNKIVSSSTFSVC